MPAGKESHAAKLLRENAEEERQKKAITAAAARTGTAFAEGSTPARKRREAEEEFSPPGLRTPARGTP
eukprot:13988245-Heterocapsa_arctica.AAC.1